MSPLTFTFSSPAESNKGRVVLTPFSDFSRITVDTWDQLAEDIKLEKTLIHYTSTVLETRWQRGHAVITLFEGRIVSYVCLAPMYSSENRHRFAAVLSVDAARLPEIDVFEFTTAWTAPEWRRCGISAQMHPPLLDRVFHAGILGTSGMAGLTSPVLSRLGWRIAGWGKLPFTSSLTAVPLNGFVTEVSTGWRPPGKLRRYEGNHIPLENAAHPWGAYTYFWISDTSLAETLNVQFSEVVDHDLDRWRKAVIEVYNAPEELHRLAFID